MGTSTRRSSRLAKKGSDEGAPSTPSASGGIRKRSIASKVKKVLRKSAPAPPLKKQDEKLPLSVFPNVELKDHSGNTFKTEDIYSKSPFVLFLYPKANTPGCTKQACGFRDNHDEFKKLGYRIFGMSYDSPKSHTNWINKKNLPYTLWTDAKNNLIAKLGASKSGRGGIKRSHFIVAKGGQILDTNIQVSPADSITKALEFAKNNPFDEIVDEIMKDETKKEGIKDDEANKMVDVDAEMKPVESLKENIKNSEEKQSVEEELEEKPEKTSVDAGKPEGSKPVAEGKPTEETKPSDDGKLVDKVSKEEATLGQPKAAGQKPSETVNKPVDEEMEPLAGEKKLEVTIAVGMEKDVPMKEGEGETEESKKVIDEEKKLDEEAQEKVTKEGMENEGKTSDVPPVNKAAEASEAVENATIVGSTQDKMTTAAPGPQGSTVPEEGSTIETRAAPVPQSL